MNDFTTCSSVFIIDFEQVRAGQETKEEIDYRVHLNEFSASKSLYWKTKQVRSTKFSFDIFVEIMFVLLLHLLIENFKPEICCQNGYDFELY